MNMSFKEIVMIILVVSTFISCVKDTPTPEIIGGLYENGYFVTNEGSFGAGNASISFISNEGIVENNVFQKANGFLLGDVLQSMNIINDNAYIVVNNSSKIEVVSVDSMNYIATITASLPRYIAQVSDNKAYVTDWGINGVQVIDLTTNNISKTISCGIGSEGIVVSNGFAYVCNKGGFGLDNTVTIINISNDMVETTLEVGDKPSSVVVDANDAVWVLTEGNTEYDANWNVVAETSGKLIKIVNNTIEANYSFPVGNHPEDLVINDVGRILYYSDGSWPKAVYSFNITDTFLPSIPLINRHFYGLGYHDEHIYGTVVPTWGQSGWSVKYNSSGAAIDSVRVGIGPNGYCFK